MKQLINVLSLLSLLATSSTLLAQQADKEAILALMQAAFDAVASQNPEDWRRIQLPEGNTLSFSATPGEEPTLLNRLRITNNEDYAAGRQPGEPALLERWIGEPLIRLHGPLASVWGEYEFLIDGEFSHCGVDALSLVKTDGQWRIANWMWTVERSGCRTPATAR
jgi:hypothetical protein